MKSEWQIGRAAQFDRTEAWWVGDKENKSGLWRELVVI